MAALACNPTVWGNTIENNSTIGINGQFGYGGGIYICISNASITYNTFENNSAFTDGGGVYIKGTSNIITGTSNILLENNMFLGNISSEDGGGLYCGSTLLYPIDNCQFTENSAENGGGIYLLANVIKITNCDFTQNTASTDGGGIYASHSTSSIENCTFDGNTATGNGGGIYMNSPNKDYPSLSRINLNSFKSNTAYLGSALYYDRIDYLSEDTYILNNLFVSNHATNKGVVYLQGNNNNTIFNHNTISDNTATSYISGVCVEKEAYFPDVVNYKNFHNNILYNYLVDILMIDTYTLPSNYSTLVNLNYIYLDPHFDPSSYYHLSSSSLGCIDAGNNSAPMTSKDLDGNQRIWNVTTDYGCYEYGSQP